MQNKKNKKVFDQEKKKVKGGKSVTYVEIYPFRFFRQNIVKTKGALKLP